MGNGPAPAGAPADPPAEYDANNCELYVDSFSLSDYTVYDTHERALEADLKVHEQQLVGVEGDEILGAGARIGVRRFHVAGAGGSAYLGVADDADTVYGVRDYAGDYQLRYVFEHQDPHLTSFTEVSDFAFFVDVKRRDGGAVRLWQRQNGAVPFTFASVYGGQTGFQQSLGNGVKRYPDQSSPVYDQRRACTGS
jgi:hypothetical protein